MSTSLIRSKVPLDELRESIACTLAGATKSYELPAIAQRLCCRSVTVSADWIGCVMICLQMRQHLLSVRMVCVNIC
jgi:hypothetical protein